MSKPSQGAYFIRQYNPSPSGEILALTFNGENNYTTVTPYRPGDFTQMWLIQDFDGATQSISPANNPEFQCGWGDAGVVVLPPGNYVWIIRDTGLGYTIQDGGETAYWGVDNPTDGSNVTIEGGQGIFKTWFLEEA